MPGIDHHPDLDTKKRWGSLLWRARCMGCSWSSDWSKDPDAVRGQYMAHFDQMMETAPAGEFGYGASRCHRCNGTGGETCFNCNGDPGEGIWECTVCQGRGIEECSLCGGHGVERRL
jgi:hypothetical protein